MPSFNFRRLLLPPFQLLALSYLSLPHLIPRSCTPQLPENHSPNALEALAHTIPPLPLFDILHRVIVPFREGRNGFFAV